jgi:hypothetical protein
LKFKGFCVLPAKKNNLALHVYEKIIKRKDEYMILGIGGKGEFFFSF